jgi:FixJ family two-component response regulator
LESAGNSVRLFSSGDAFLESGALADLDCLMSDISMPGIDGFGLLRITDVTVQICLESSSPVVKN